MFFILTGNRRWSEEQFLASGEDMAAKLVRCLTTGTPQRRALEIGCGLGRVSRHLARSFERVDAVDVSPTMIEKARALHDAPNLHFRTNSGTDLSDFGDATFDAVFSVLVMQHLPDEALIEAYLREIARVLTADGRAVVQFDTRPQRRLVAWYKALPDLLLPAVHRRCVRRYRRCPQRLRIMASAAGLRIVNETDPGTEDHMLVLARDRPARDAQA